MQEQNEILFKKIIEKQEEQDEKLAYILNNQNARLDKIFTTIKKSKWARFWRFTLRLLIFLLFFFLFFVFIKIIFSPIIEFSTIEKIENDHIAVINISGPISSDSNSNAKYIINSLNDAIKNPLVKSIILDINSPGGSPVQSAYIYQAIMELKAKKPIYALIGDLGASGAYYVASAATEIYAHKSSLVGSIGVISMNFGVKDLMRNIGVEARIFTAGENKAFMNSFDDLSAEEAVFWQELLDETHSEFIADVKNARGAKLTQDEKIFSGLIFTGKQSKSLGLVDDLASLEDLRKRLGNLILVDYTKKLNFWEKLSKTSSGVLYNLLTNFDGVKLR